MKQDKMYYEGLRKCRPDKGEVRNPEGVKWTNLKK